METLLGWFTLLTITFIPFLFFMILRIHFFIHPANQRAIKIVFRQTNWQELSNKELSGDAYSLRLQLDFRKWTFAQFYPELAALEQKGE